jgi:hypothetical protein
MFGVSIGRSIQSPSPVEASSGNETRHRLHPRGNRKHCLLMLPCSTTRGKVVTVGGGSHAAPTESMNHFV